MPKLNLKLQPTKQSGTAQPRSTRLLRRGKENNVAEAKTPRNDGIRKLGEE